MDYFRERTPYYEREGLAIVWPWMKNGTECMLAPVDMDKPHLRLTAAKAAQYHDTALVLYWSLAYKAGCKTFAQVGLTAQGLGRGLQKLGYPPLSLIIMLFFSNATVPVAGPNINMYHSASLSIPDGPPAIDMTMLNQWDSLRFYERFRLMPFSMNFKAIQEPGVWNDAFLSPMYTIYTSVLFAAVLVMLVFILIRFYRLQVNHEVPRDTRLAIMVLTFIYCTILLAHYIITNTTLVGRIVESVVMVLSTLSVELATWYWIARAKNIFSRTTRIIFFTCIAVHMVLLIVTFACNIGFIFTWTNEKRSAILTVLTTYVTPFVPFIGLVIFGSFAIWFGSCAYRVRHNSEACSRSLKLMFISILTTVTFLAATAKNVVTLWRSGRTDIISVSDVVALELASATTYAMRAFVCFMVIRLSCRSAKSSASIYPTIDSTPKPPEDTDWNKHAWQHADSAFNDSPGWPPANMARAPQFEYGADADKWRSLKADIRAPA
ncbi:hypothetical protein THASP1DRAFT_32999 [Thamnocephalis sphaerospora]|uniref:Uncharacterized protein n=1 Tax=Thamnocephalis sphaerospora TaxID=78915 RepID=A0A4P9XIH6_9FUNG|nr:hypothetical protein THASP1DRAFT_32999 [Thamnocephalis sphaerospora]|eukprot:RKP05161.1 hypothetical protein THASP1DRAFT_32999 [Thamnocephalis sphaerospora]